MRDDALCPYGRDLTLYYKMTCAGWIKAESHAIIASWCGQKMPNFRNIVRIAVRKLESSPQNF